MNIPQEIAQKLNELNVPQIPEAPEHIEGKTLGCNCCEGTFDRDHMVCTQDGFFCMRCMCGALEVLLSGYPAQTPGHILDPIRENEGYDTWPTISAEELEEIGALGAFNKFFHHEETQGFAGIDPAHVGQMWTEETVRCDACQQSFLPEDMMEDKHLCRPVCSACWFSGMGILESAQE